MNKHELSIQKYIRYLHIKTKRLLQSKLVHDRITPLRGSGFEFDQIRDYSVGDDIRFIDWNAYARTNNLMVKQYHQERSRSILIALDISASTEFGTGIYSKREYANTIAGMLAFAGHYGQDAVGLLLFSQDVEFFVPPQHNRAHTYSMLNHIFHTQARMKGTSLGKLAQYLQKLKKKSLILLLSDFIDSQEYYYSSLKNAGKKHEIIAIRTVDFVETCFPSVGFLHGQDSENEQIALLDTRMTHKELRNWLLNRRILEKKGLQKCGLKVVDLVPNHSSLDHFIKSFCIQMRY